MLLVHGGCHGAWCWGQVIEGLTARGVASRAFDLPGCGADETPRSAITLADQVEAAVAQVDALPDGPVRLIGHSIGGWLLPPVAAARPERVTEVVFVAAAVLNRGESGIGVTPVERRAGYYELAAASPDNSLMITFEAAWGRFFQHLGEAEARQAYARLTPQPFQPYLDPAIVGVEDIETPRRYVAFDDDRTYPDESTITFAAKAGVLREVVPGDHCAMLSAPHVVVAALA